MRLVISAKKSLELAATRQPKCRPSEILIKSPVTVASRLFSGKINSEDDVSFYNSLSQKIESLPETSKAIGWYTCGPTTYAPAHLGHARTYVCIDIMRRVIEARVSVPPLFTMNITDIDDKILTAANEVAESPIDLARRYELEFWEDMDSLNCLRPHVVARVTERVESDIVPYIQTLVDKGVAYDTEDGIYFDVKSFSEKFGHFSKYGKLSPHSTTEHAEETDGVKRDQRDFVLWKKRKSNESVYWESPWGEGRPGWHIECSAIIESIQRQFDETHHFSVHAGGVDLKFPHHTNEIAQAEAHGEGEWINHWVHTGHLHIDGLKMSKSLKNFISIRDFLDKYDMSSSIESPGDDFRLWCLALSGSYRAPATFSESRLAEARSVRQKILRFLHGGEAWLSRAGSDVKLWSDQDVELHKLSIEAKRNCVLALQSDFNGPKFLSEMMRIIEAGNTFFARSGGSVEAGRTALRIVRELLRLVGFSDKTVDAGLSHSVVHSKESRTNNGIVDKLVSLRSRIRNIALHQTSSVKASNELLELCDEVRESLLEQGVEIMDSQSGESDGWRPCLPKSYNTRTMPSDDCTIGQQLDLYTVPLEEFFKVGKYAGQFSQFDSDDMPTHNSDGSEVSKRMRKKLLKKREIHSKRIVPKIEETQSR